MAPQSEQVTMQSEHEHVTMKHEYVTMQSEQEDVTMKQIWTFLYAVWTWICYHVIWTCHHAVWTWICHHSISTWTCHHLIGEFVTIYLVISLQPWTYLAVNMLQFILWTVPKHKHDFFGVNMSHLIVCELFTNMMEVTVLKLTNQLQAN